MESTQQKNAFLSGWDEAALVSGLVREGALNPEAAKRIGKSMTEGLKRRGKLALAPEKAAELLEKVEAGFERAPELSENAVKVLEKRYLKKDAEGQPIETPRQMFVRVAKALASGDANFGHSEAEIAAAAREFYDIMVSLEFVPNSPTLMNAGRELGQLSACFVLPVEDDMACIFETIKQAALVHKSGGGTGFSFARLRPKSDRVLSTMGVASGPVSFMKVFDKATETIKQGGTRRGANMGMLSVEHPDILEFVRMKDDRTVMTNFNVSVLVTEKFMTAVEKGEDYDLVNPHNQKVVRRLNAREVFDEIVKHAWDSGEPGIVFIDRVNYDNPTPHVGMMEATNPCGEQPLLPYESCNLGSINLAKFVRPDKSYDWDRLKQVVHTATHFLDNVVETNLYPIPQIEAVTRYGNRKIGLGVMGWADLLIELGIPYCSPEAVEMGRKMMAFIDEESKVASSKLAEERGVFPNWKGSRWDPDSGLGTPKMNGRKLRNATTTTIAPTGTISIIAGCSGGIEPIFAISFVRNQAGMEMLDVNPAFERIAKERGFYSEALMRKIAAEGTVAHCDEVPEDVRRVFTSAHDVTPEWHIRQQAAWQERCDNAVSKTCNFPKSATEQEIRDVYWLAYKLGCKGVTVYRDGSREEQVLNIGEVNRKPRTAEGVSAFGGGAAVPAGAEVLAALPAGGEELFPVRPKVKHRPDVMHGSTYKMTTGEGNLYVTITRDEEGPFEVFAALGKAGGSAAANVEAISRLISLGLRAGVAPELVAQQLTGIRAENAVWKEGELITSVADAIARALKKDLAAHEEKPAAVEVVPEGAAMSIGAAKKANGNGAPKNGNGAHAAAGGGHPGTPHKSGPGEARSFSACPSCGSSLEMSEGCKLCRNCGFSKCS
jgi:ribonucleoside-diphosphate reductase alpha chain